jgi:pimeloyl-ACP methyl ester carboxylesterase
MLRVLRNARIPIFLHRKSNHIFTVWQHMVLLVIRQYEGRQAADCNELMGTLNIDRTHIIGHSFGGTSMAKEDKSSP